MFFIDKKASPRTRKAALKAELAKDDLSQRTSPSRGNFSVLKDYASARIENSVVYYCVPFPDIKARGPAGPKLQVSSDNMFAPSCRPRQDVDFEGKEEVEKPTKIMEKTLRSELKFRGTKGETNCYILNKLPVQKKNPSLAILPEQNQLLIEAFVASKIETARKLSLLKCNPSIAHFENYRDSPFSRERITASSQVR